MDRLKLRAGDYSSNCFSEKVNACFQTSNLALLSLESNLICKSSLQSSDSSYLKSVVLVQSLSACKTSEYLKSVCFSAAIELTVVTGNTAF